MVNEAQGPTAGIDEVGRGALFGPVVAAAVILKPAAADSLIKAGVRDSKQLRPSQRDYLYGVIRDSAIDCRIGWASAHEIDRLNILQASLLAMRRAVQRLLIQPGFCLVDGNQPIPNFLIPQRTVIKGDQSEPAIAAASIIAKVWRDRLIIRLDQRYPGYGLTSNKGYGSLLHRKALMELGPCSQHRLSFAPCLQAQALNRKQLSETRGGTERIEL